MRPAVHAPANFAARSFSLNIGDAYTKKDSNVSQHVCILLMSIIFSQTSIMQNPFHLFIFVRDDWSQSKVSSCIDGFPHAHAHKPSRKRLEPVRFDNMRNGIGNTKSLNCGEGGGEENRANAEKDPFPERVGVGGWRYVPVFVAGYKSNQLGCRRWMKGPLHLPRTRFFRGQREGGIHRCQGPFFLRKSDV
jgi:hypothetical protein